MTQINNYPLNIKTILETIKAKLLKEPVDGAKVNVFNFEGKSFILDHTLAKEVQEIIVNQPVNKEYKNILAKTYRLTKLVSKIRDILKKEVTSNGIAYKDLISPVTKTFLIRLQEKDYVNIAHIINDNIAYAILEQVNRHFSDDEHETALISYVELSMIIGIPFIQWWFDKLIVNKRFKKDKDTIYLQIDALCKKLELTFFADDVRVWFYNCILIKASMLNYNNNTVIRSKIAAKIGSYFVECLIKHKVLDELQTTINKTRYLGLSDIYEEDIKLSTAFYKPILSPLLSCKTIKNQKKLDKYKFNFISKQHKFDPKFTYVKSLALNECLATNDTKYCINGPFLDLYLEYKKIIFTIPFRTVLLEPFSEDAQKIKDYIYITYQLRIDNIISSCPKALVIDLIDFMQDDKLLNITLSKKFANNFKMLRKQLDGYKTNARELPFTGKYIKDYLTTDVSSETKTLTTKITITRLLWDAYSKIAAQKFFINFFLEDACIFRHFEHFFLEKEMTGVSRVSFIPYFVNYQTNRFVRPFLTYFSEHKIVDEKTFTITKDIFSSVLTKTKYKFNQLSFSEYKTRTMAYQHEFLSHFFKSTLTLEELMNFNFPSLLETITNFLKYAKKGNEALYGMAIWHYMLNKNSNLYVNIEPIIFLDSTNSVTQHIASTFRNKVSAKYGCLTDTKYFDINTFCLEQYNMLINIKLPDEASKYLNYLNLTKDDLLKEDSHKQVFHKLYQIICDKEQCSNLNNLDNYLKDIFSKCEPFLKEKKLPTIDSEFKKEFISISKDLSYLMEVESTDKRKDLIFMILVILYDHSITHLVNNNPWILSNLNSRDIIKPRIMPEAYGMTAMGGYDAITKAFLKKALEEGQYAIDLSCIRIFAHMISSYFYHSFRPKYLSYMEEFLKIRNYLKYRKEEKTLSMSTEYITWIYTPKETKTMRINVKRLRQSVLEEDDIDNISTNTNNKNSTKGTRRFLNIGYMSNELDKRKIRNAVCVHAIHTQETYIMLKWLITAQQLNKLLNTHANLEYYYTPNYDCFGTNFKHITFLRYHIEHCYRYCDNGVILKNILKLFKDDSKCHQQIRASIQKIVKLPNDNDYWDGDITNDYFVKY